MRAIRKYKLAAGRACVLVLQVPVYALLRIPFMAGNIQNFFPLAGPGTPAGDRMSMRTTIFSQALVKNIQMRGRAKARGMGRTSVLFGPVC
jgi:hypothetical protein